MDLLNGLVQHLEQRVGSFYNDITKSSDKTSSQPVDEQYWPVATASILDVDEQNKLRRKALTAAQATYSTLVQQRLEVAEQLSILKQQRAKLPDKQDSNKQQQQQHDHFENQMRKMLWDYQRLETDVFEAREVLVAAKQGHFAARSTGVAVFMGTSDTERLRLRSTPTSKDGVTKERRATLRSSSLASHARVPSTESCASSSSTSSSNQFHRARSSPREHIKTVNFAVTFAMTPEDGSRSAMHAAGKNEKHGRTVAGWQPALNQVTVVNRAARPQIQRSLHGAEVHARLQDAASRRCGHPQAH